MFSTTQINNFFNDPDKILNKAESCSYYKSKKGWWPGERSKSLHILYPKLFNQIISSVLSNFFSQGEQINFQNAEVFFHKIKPYKNYLLNKGWIHRDDCELAGLIYLNKKFTINTGTGMYIPKQEIDYKDSINQKINLYLNNIYDEKKYEKTMLDMEKQFTKVAEFQNIYNNFVCYPGNNFHRLENFGTEERLTLVFFIGKIDSIKQDV